MLFRRTALSIAAILVGGAAEGEKNVTKGGCPSTVGDIERAFKACIRNAGISMMAIKECKAQFENCRPSDMLGDVKVPGVGDRITIDVAMKAVSKCVMAGGSNCDALYKELTGKNLTTFDDPMQRKTAERFMALMGFEEVMGSDMIECMNSSSTALARKDCKDAAREQFMNVMNLTGLDEASRHLFDKELLKAAMAKAGEFISECIAVASPEDKKKCLTSRDAKKQAALASGKDENDITEQDLLRAAMGHAQDSISRAIKACMVNASTDVAKMSCRGLTDFKDLIANSMAETKDSIKDSKVFEYMSQGAADDVLTVMKACTKGLDSVTLEACIAEARRVKAQASGRKESEVTEFDLDMDKARALGRDIMVLMEVCMKNSTTSEGREGCKSAARVTMQEADMSGVAPSRAQLEMMLEKATVSALKGVRETCGDVETTCLNAVKEKIAAVSGMRKEDITILQAQTFQVRAASEAARDSVYACVQAKKDNMDATCDDPFAKFMQALGKPTEEKMSKTEKAKLRLTMAKDTVEEAMRICYQHALQADVATCVREATNQTDAVMEHLMVAASLGSEVLMDRMKQMREEAGIEALASIFSACLRGANSTADARACVDDLRAKASNAEVEEEEDSIIRRYAAKLLSAPASVCTSTSMKQCRDEAINETIALGVEIREFATMKKVGELRAAANAWVACKDAGGASADCDKQAKADFQAVSGAEEGAFDSTVIAEVRNLAAAIIDGAKLVLVRRKRVDVTLKTLDTACVTAIEDNMANKTEEAAADNGTREANTTKRPCRLVDALAEYGAFLAANLSDSRLAALAEAIAAKLQGADLNARRLGQQRRLATVDQAFASQDLALCGEGDASCETGKFEPSSGEASTPAPSPTPGDTPTPSPTPGNLPSPSPGDSPTPAPAPKKEGTASLARKALPAAKCVVSTVFAVLAATSA